MARSFKVNINPQLIKWARTTAGWTPSEIANKLKISLEEYLNLEAGKSKPTFKQLELLAKYLKRPLSAFFLHSPPKEPPLSSVFSNLTENS